MAYQALTEDNIQLPRVLSPMANPVWMTVSAPSSAPGGLPNGQNFQVTGLCESAPLWVVGDTVTLDGVPFVTTTTPATPTQIPAGDAGDALASLCSSINNHPRFRSRYYASYTFLSGPGFYELKVISLRPGQVYDVAFTVSRLPPATDPLLFDITFQSGAGPTQGEDFQGYGTTIEVWAQQAWEYLDGNTSYTPGVDATQLVQLDQNYRAGGEYEFDLSSIVSTLLPDWRPELNFTPRVFTASGGTEPGYAGALAAYFIKAGQYRTTNGFRKRTTEYDSGPLFTWRGAIKAANPTFQEWKRTTGIGLPNGRQQEMLSSLFNPIGRDRALGMEATSVNISKTQSVAYLSFLHTRLAFQEGKEITLCARYTWLDPATSAPLLYDGVQVYGGNPNPRTDNNQISKADIYYARIDWNKIKYQYESVLAEYYAPGTTEEEYPLLKADFFWAYADSTIYRITEYATVAYSDEGCPDEYQPTLVFRNHWGAFEAVQMRAGYIGDIARESKEWTRNLTRAATYKDIQDLIIIDSVTNSITFNSKNLSPLESEWLRELVASDRVYLYYNGPDWTQGFGVVRPPNVEQLIPIVVSNAKMTFDTNANANYLQVVCTLSNHEQAWSTPLTDQRRIALSQGTGSGGGGIGGDIS